MSIFTRVRDLLSANVNSMLDSAEDPEKMAAEYLRQLNNELYEAKTSVAAAMADASVLPEYWDRVCCRTLWRELTSDCLIGPRLVLIAMLRTKTG